ncbi:MAG: 3'-5' exonuclease [Cyanobacteria bacterium P01_C01_bin.73]
MVSAATYSGQSALLSTELLAYYRQLSQSSLTVIDVETTGSLAHNARVIEISVLQGSLAEGIMHQQATLINPGIKIPRQITRLTGITEDMVSPAPSPAQTWAEYLPLLKTGVLTAHNLEFDYGFVKAEYQRQGDFFSRPSRYRFCTVMLSRLLLADLPSRSLPNLVEHFGFPVGTSHRAEADTLACWYLAELLLKRIQDEPDETLLKQFGRQWIRLKDAAAMLRCPKKAAFDLLKARDIDVKLSRRRQTPLYRRQDVETIFWEQQGQQLSLLQDEPFCDR